MCDYLESTANCLYGNACHSEEKVLYSRSQRKCKNAVMGITTLITIANIVVDWYNFVFYENNTKKDIIYTKDETTEALFWTFLGLCLISTVLLLCELVSFVLQLRDSRNYESPVKRSELCEEIVSWCILFFENLGIPLIFLIGYFMGICPMVAQIRSFTGRIALVVAAVSVLWRLIQSLSYCILCKDSTILMLICQSFRVFRIFLILCSLAVIAFLLSISMSLEIGIRVDRYNGRYHGAQYSDIQKSVYLYQRITAPYMSQMNNSFNNCSYLESKIEIAKSMDLEELHGEPLIKQFPCEKFSPFYTSLISEKHRELLSSYSCNIIIGIKNSDLTSARIVNAAYELRDTNSMNCVSDAISINVDRKYNPRENHAIEARNVWNTDVTKAISDSMCENHCNYTMERPIGPFPIFHCDLTPCLQNQTIIDEPPSLALLSQLLVSENELKSYYPCMPNVNLYSSIDLPLCEKENNMSHANDGDMDNIVSYTTCLQPYLTFDEESDSWITKEQQYLEELRLS